MAKFIVTANCRIDRKHVAKGTEIELDPMDKTDMDKLAILNMNSRLVDFTPENRKMIDAEIKAEKAHEERIAEQNRILSGRQRQQPVPA